MNAKRAKRIRRVARRALALNTEGTPDGMAKAWRKACDELEPNMKTGPEDQKKVTSIVGRLVRRSR
jgi:hypothetical protein